MAVSHDVHRDKLGGRRDEIGPLQVGLSCEYVGKSGHEIQMMLAFRRDRR